MIPHLLFDAYKFGYHIGYIIGILLIIGIIYLVIYGAIMFIKWIDRKKK